MTTESDWQLKRQEIKFDFYRALKFALSIIYEIVTASLIVLGIKTMEAIISPELKFLGWSVHDIALVLETLVLLGFFISSVINHFNHMFGSQLDWLMKRFRRPT